MAQHYSVPDTQSSFWNQSLHDLLVDLQSSECGLDAADATKRLAAHGENALGTRRRRAVVLDYLAHLRGPLVLLLLGACVVSAVMGDATSAVVIATIVLASVTLDFVQERRAGNAADRLRRSVAIRATILRDGAAIDVPTTAIVPGDILHLSAGDLVPADGRVLAARDFFVRQAALTGEAYPVEKRAGDVAEADMASAANSAFMGSSVLSGSATLLVCRTGRSTFLGTIADSLRQAPAPTAFERGTRGFGEMIVKMTTVLVLFVVLVNLLAHRPLAETFLFAVALAVGLTPELLPMVVSVTLARGAMRMARRKVVVKRLPAIQNMGSMDVLCTDKTGTLTESIIRLESHVDVDGRDCPRVLQLAWINSHFESGLRSPLDDAILAQAGGDAAGWTKIDEVPFGFERRRVSVLVEKDGVRMLVVKGAPEDLLALCSRCERASSDVHPGVSAWNDEARAQALARFNALSRDGLRVLAIAWRDVPQEHDRACVVDERDLVFCGFAVFLDPPKAGAAQALAQLRSCHVQVKVVTGDNEGVTRHVCEQVGLPIHNLLTGADIERLDDAALAVQGAVRPGVLSCIAGSEEPHHPGGSRAAATSSATSATGSTMRLRCTTPTSGSRSTAPSTSRKKPQT